MAASILNQVQIGAHSVIGAGSLVLNNVEEHSVVYGSPASWRRGRKTGEPYLSGSGKASDALTELVSVETPGK